MEVRQTRARIRTAEWRLLVAIAAAIVMAGGWPAQAGAQSFPGFTPLPGTTPEGVAVDRIGNLYVTVRDGTLGTIWQYTLDGQRSLYATIGQGMIGGLAARPNGDLYVAMAAGPDQGVYRVGRDRMVEKLPGTDQIVFANALAFDARGNLYVTESYSRTASEYGQGGIWHIRPGEDAQLWLRDPLLTGIGYLGFPVGANGIAYYHGDLYVANTDKGLIVRVPITGDGSAGEPSIWKTLEPVAGLPPIASPFPVMPDGLALDVNGNVYVAVVSRNSILRINADDRSQETLALLMTPRPDLYTRAPLDTPASLAFGTGAGEQQNLFVTNLGWMVNMAPPPPGMTWPGPGIVKVNAGFPGRPLQ